MSDTEYNLSSNSICLFRVGADILNSLFLYDSFMIHNYGIHSVL